MPSIYPSFAPTAEVPRVWIGAERLSNPTGAALDMVGSRYPAFLFDQAADETVRGGLYLPSGWASAKIQCFWANAAAGAGSVHWKIDVASPDAAGSLTVDTGSQAVVAPAGAASVLVVSLAPTAMPFIGGTVNHIRVTRLGSAGDDTLPNDAGLIGLLLTRV